MTKLINTVGWLTFWAFLGLKLSGAIAWSWVTVFIPLYVVAGFWGIIFGIFAVVGIGTAVAVQKGAGKEIENAFKRIRT